MKILAFTIACVAMMACSIEAQAQCRGRNCQPQPQCVGPNCYRSGGSVAQQKANQQASEGRMRHVGGSFGAGTHEGVGFSTRSADAAIRASCYWGQRTPVDIGVTRGANGWYATVLYR